MNVRRSSRAIRALLIGSAVVFASCSSAASQAPSQAPTQSPSEAVPTATPTPTPKPLRVGLVTDVGGLKDRGFNALAAKGLQDAIDTLGVEGRTLESKSDADYTPNITQLADEGYDLVISVGFTMADATGKAAALYPNTKFAIIDAAFDPAIPNATGILFREQDAAFLTGYLAGLITPGGFPRTNDKLVVSTVGLVKIPPVDRYIAGFLFGAKYVNPSIQIMNAYSQDFVDAAKCKEIALQQIAAGSDVLLSGAPCGFGAYDAAKEKGTWAVSGDVDLTYLGPQMLTSAEKRVDVGVLKTIQSVIAGTFAGGSATTYGLADGGVSLGPVSSEIPQSVVDQVKAIEPKVISGEIKIPTDPAKVK